MPPIKAPLWTTSCKIETNVFPLFHIFNLYKLELNCGKTIWDKTKVLLGTSWGTHLGTFWELDGNKGKTQKCLYLAPSKNKTRPLN